MKGLGTTIFLFVLLVGWVAATSSIIGWGCDKLGATGVVKASALIIIPLSAVMQVTAARANKK